MRTREEVQAELERCIKVFYTKITPSQASRFDEIVSLYEELEHAEKKNYKTEIERLLEKLELSPALNGYTYICDTLIYMLDNNVKRLQGTEIYSRLSRKFDIPKSTIEYNVKNSVEKIFRGRNYSLINDIFPSYSSRIGKVGNTKFINGLANYLRDTSHFLNN